MRMSNSTHCEAVHPGCLHQGRRFMAKARRARPPGRWPARRPEQNHHPEFTPIRRTGSEKRHRFRAVLAILPAVFVVGTLLGSAQAAPAVFQVNDTRDMLDRSPGDGECATSSGTCTMRAAILESNALAGAETIQVLPGIYPLEIPVINDDTPETGD